MNNLQTALHGWHEQKAQYQKSIKIVLNDVSKPIKCIPSAEYESREEELRQYLRYNYTYDEDDSFNEVYVQHIAGNNNMTLMELANKLIQQLGGTIKFWQNKIIDVASNSTYPPDLTIWEPNRAYQHYMGLSPQFTHRLRKKRSLAKNYLNCLVSLCKLIDKSKPLQDDLSKIDQGFKKLKKAQEKYYAFVEEVENVSSKDTSTISLIGKNQAKNSLFMFLKQKDDKVNTLANYKFKVQKVESSYPTKLLKGQEFEQFDSLFQKIKTTSRSQRQSAYSEASKSNCKKQTEQGVPINQLRSEYVDFMAKGRLQVQAKREQQDQNTFIWSNQYFFSYWGFPIKYIPMDFTRPFEMYGNINYEIDSEDEYDELTAEDVDVDDEYSEEQSISNPSFVVEDDFDSQEQKDKDMMYLKKSRLESDRWSKSWQDLQQYQILCIQEDLPLPLEDTTDNFEQSFLTKLEGKGRTQIMSIFALEKKDISKNRVDRLLKNDFKKVKKNKQIVYHRSNKTQISDKKTEIVEGLSENETSAQIYEISVSCPTKTKTTRTVFTQDRSRNPSNSKRKNRNNQTIMEQSYAKEE